MGPKKITPVEHSTLLQAFHDHKNMFGTLKNPSPGFTQSLDLVRQREGVRLCNG